MAIVIGLSHIRNTFRWPVEPEVGEQIDKELLYLQ
jgi:hypothetical protein